MRGQHFINWHVPVSIEVNYGKFVQGDILLQVQNHLKYKKTEFHYFIIS